MTLVSANASLFADMMTVGSAAMRQRRAHQCRKNELKMFAPGCTICGAERVD
jgi:hypothetical protein